MLTIYNPIGTSFMHGFQLSNKKSFILYLFEIPLVDPLTLTIILSLFNPYINITSQSSLQLIFCYYLFLYLQFIQLTSLWFDSGLAGLFTTSTLLHLGEDINSLIVSRTQGTLLSNNVTNPKEHVKAISLRSRRTIEQL